MLSSNQIKINSTFSYKGYTLKVLSKRTGSIELINSKEQTYFMDTRALLEDVRLGFCTFNQ